MGFGGLEMRIFLTEIFVVSIFNLACYFALKMTGDVKRYFKETRLIILIGNILIVAAVPIFGFGVLVR